MGVPVVTRAGVDHRARVGMSILCNAGLPELVAKSDDEFVSIAASYASKPDELATLRRTMRSRLSASPLLDANGFTRALERSYREMWVRWCTSESGHESVRVAVSEAGAS
jgi:predicted O-linked N-acetylglucosamine transferase (SPINDLY family)